MKKQKLFLYIAPILLLIGLIGYGSTLSSVGTLFSAPAQAAQAITAPATNPSSNPPAVVSKNDTLTAIEGTLTDIYNQVNPSVVSIQVAQKAQISNMPQLPGGMPFFFGQPQGQLPQGSQPEYQYGAGSGFVWDTQGHIITNNHVVDGADQITVTFADGSTVPAQVVGTDPDSDLAVLKVDVPASQLHPVTMGDSSQLKVGQLTVAIGNPFGLENTMTVGFVSAIGRVLPVSSGQQGMFGQQGPSYTIPEIIQTDAPINPGNSGGVLVNDQGQVIGVTAAIESPVRASSGVGFAIPAAIVDKVVPSLIQTGHFEHTWLGLSGLSLNPELDQAMNLKADQRGALIEDITPNSPADQAGLQGSDRQVTIMGQQMRVGGDVIVAIDGQPVKTFDDLVAYLFQSTKVGQTVTLTVLHQGQQEDVKVTLAARPTANNAAPMQIQQSPQGLTTNKPRLGIEAVTVSPAIAAAMNLSADQQGVLVEQVVPGSPAAQANLQGSDQSATINGQMFPVGGDIITAADGQPINNLQDLQSYLQQVQPGQTVTLTILRAGNQVQVPVTFGQAQ